MLQTSIPVKYEKKEKLLNRCKRGKVGILLGCKLRNRTTVDSRMPATVSFELTNHCNLRCPECASGSGMMLRERGFMDPALLKKHRRTQALAVVRESLLPGRTIPASGIILLYPDVRKYKGYNKHKRSFLDGANSGETVRSGIYKLIVSLDGMDQKHIQNTG